MELHAPEDDIIFHDKGDRVTPLNRQRQQGEDLAMGGEVQEEHGNTPSGLSPPRRYIPAGAEGDETGSSESIHNEEETLEEELDHYFSNPSYRAIGLPPLVPKKKIGEIFPLHPCHHKPHKNFLNQQQDLKRGRGICKGGGKAEDKIGGEEIMMGIT